MCVWESGHARVWSGGDSPAPPRARPRSKTKRQLPLPPTTTPPQAELVVLTKAGASTGVRLAFAVGAPALVGRAPRSTARLKRGAAARPALALDNATVSASHATLHVAPAGGGATITDAGGRNGTWIVRRSGALRGVARRLPRGGRARIGHGDEVMVGGVRARLEVSGGVRVAPAAVPPAPRGAGPAPRGGGGATGAQQASALAPLPPRAPGDPPPLHIVRLSSAVAADPAARAACAAAGLTVAPSSGPSRHAWGVLVAAPPDARGGGFTRSLNWLLAIAGGRPVASPAWLAACAAAGRAVPVSRQHSVSSDPAAEAANSFNLAAALATSARAPMLLVRIVAASPLLLAAEADGGEGLVALVAAAGGTLAAGPPPSRGANAARPVSWLGIAANASPAERAWAARALPPGARVLSRAQFVDALLAQALPAAGMFTAGKE